MNISPEEMNNYLKYAFYGMVELADIPKNLMSNKEFVLKLASQKGMSAILLCYISKELKDDFDIVKEIILNHDIYKYGFFEKRINGELSKSRSDVIEGSKCHYTKILGENVLKKREFWMLLNQRILEENERISNINKEKNTNFTSFPLLDVEAELLAVDKYFKNKNIITPQTTFKELSENQKQSKPKIRIFQNIYGYYITEEEAYKLGLIEKLTTTSTSSIYRLSPNQLNELNTKYEIEYIISKCKVKIYSDHLDNYYEDENKKKIITEEEYKKLEENILIEIEKVYIHPKMLLQKTIINIYTDNMDYYLDGQTAYYLYFRKENIPTKYYKLTEEEHQNLKNNPNFEIKYLLLKGYNTHKK